jgi:tetratricopeptide (TPR) repeat protein
MESQPDFLPGLVRRGSLHESRHNYSAAIADYETAIRIDPSFSIAHRELAWLLATCEQEDIRNGPKALEHAKLFSARRRFRTMSSISTLAAAYAECGDFKKAAEVQEEAKNLDGYAPDGVKWAELYRSGKPFHRPAEPTNAKPQPGEEELILK